MLSLAKQKSPKDPSRLGSDSRPKIPQQNLLRHSVKSTISAGWNTREDLLRGCLLSRILSRRVGVVQGKQVKQDTESSECQESTRSKLTRCLQYGTGLPSSFTLPSATVVTTLVDAYYLKGLEAVYNNANLSFPI